MAPTASSSQKYWEKAGHFRCVLVARWSESMQNGANRPIICWSELDGLRHQETLGVEMGTEVIDICSVGWVQRVRRPCSRLLPWRTREFIPGPRRRAGSGRGQCRPEDSHAFARPMLSSTWAAVFGERFPCRPQQKSLECDSNPKTCHFSAAVRTTRAPLAASLCE